MNSGNYKISEIDDPRILAQGLLDYFDNFTTQAIQNQFIDAVHLQINTQVKLTKKMKNQLFSQLDKKEFLLIECFVRFFANLITENETNLINLRKAILRLCISLVLERKKWDKLFLKRSLIKEHSGDDKVMHLYVFMLKWIENYSETFKEHYMIAKSPLKLNEEKVEEKMKSSEKRRGTFLNQVVTPAISRFTADSPIRFKNEIDLLGVDSANDSTHQQANQNALSPDSSESKYPYSGYV